MFEVGRDGIGLNPILGRLSNSGECENGFLEPEKLTISKVKPFCSNPENQC
jgi:hypothetical protein